MSLPAIESLGLGLVPMKSYRVDHAFFDQFRKSGDCV
jgi:hypothetical protein